MCKRAEHLEFQSALMPQTCILVAEPCTLEVLPEARSIYYYVDVQQCVWEGVCLRLVEETLAHPLPIPLPLPLLLPLFGQTQV